MTLENNRAPLLCNIKLYASFHHYMWIQTGVTVRKRLSWVVTSVTLTFDLWPWPFPWTLPWSLVITPENFMMIRWWEHSQKGATDRQTDGQTENTIIIQSALCLQIGRNCSTIQRLETAGISVTKIWWGLRWHMTSCPTKFVLNPVSGLSENVRKLPHQSEARHRREISGALLKVD